MKDLAINGGVSTKTKDFPKWPVSEKRELELLTEVIESGNWWRMSGNKVDTFEERFAKYHNASYCLGVTNGTHAIELVLAGLGIGAGDEVIVPAFTFISTASAPIYANATPIPVDVCKDTFCMMPESFEAAITTKTKAVIPVHMAGHMCDMEKIKQIADRHNIKVIEDSAHAHGAEFENKNSGYYSDAAIFSFQNGKIMTCGEGGAIITNNKSLYEKLYLIHGVGRPKNDRIYDHVLLGSNYRMNEFQGAILLSQLERLDSHNTKREHNAKLLDKLLSDISGITPQKYKREATLNTHYMYMFYYDNSKFNGLSRKEFVDILIAEGVPAFIAYPIVSNTEFFMKNQFRGHINEEYSSRNFNLPNAKKIADEVIWLPHFTLLGDEDDIIEIFKAIEKIQKSVNRKKDD